MSNHNPVFTRNDLIISLDEAACCDVDLVGGKAQHCGRLKRAGFAVPNGFVITSRAVGHVEQLSKQLAEALATFAATTQFAVRSSGIGEDGIDHSFAGIHDTKLNVPRCDVLAAVQACWESVRSPAALAYRSSRSLPTDNLCTGVLVQRMVAPEVAGVAFTMDPVTGYCEEMVINSSWGLGEAVVGGQVDADEFRVRKIDGRLVSRRVGEKAHRVVAEKGASWLVPSDHTRRNVSSLSDARLRELVEMLAGIESHFGGPQDVEWCHDGEQFWLLQARPVTGRRSETGRDTEWTRANVREVLPDLPSPLTTHLTQYSVEHASRRFFGGLLAPKEERGPMVKVFYGRPYFNLSQLRVACHRAGIPLSTVMRGLGHADIIREKDTVVRSRTWRESCSTLPDRLRIARAFLMVPKLSRRCFVALGDVTERLAKYQPEALPDEQLLEIAKRESEVASASPELTILLMAGISHYTQKLRTLCSRTGHPSDDLLQAHLVVGDKSVTGQLGLELVALADCARAEPKVREYFAGATGALTFHDHREALQGTSFVRKLNEFLALFGHRGPYESDLAIPSYGENPTPLLQAIATHVMAPSHERSAPAVDRRRLDAERFLAEFSERFSQRQKLTVLPRVRRVLSILKRWITLRERNRSEFLRLCTQLRHWHLVLARRFVERGWIGTVDDYFFLHSDEIGKAATTPTFGSELATIVAGRRSNFESWRTMKMPSLFRESELPRLMRRENASSLLSNERALHGLCVSAGQVEGEVIVVRSPDDFSQMRRGAILVAPATGPAWTALFTLASGIVVEIGGTSSHAATVAREYGLPAVANVRDATQILRDGQRIKLDATRGVVEIL